MKLIVGLGNPGQEFNNTRHNIGFKVIDNYLGDVSFKKKFEAEFYKDSNNDVIFIKPLTYMNNSGLSVKQFIKYFDIQFEDVLVIQDDLDLSIGAYRFKFNSSSGGHNGIKSIINEIGSQEFGRLKVGISNNSYIDTKDFVLSKFTKEEIKKIDFNIFNDAINDFIKYDINYVMNKYNGK